MVDIYAEFFSKKGRSRGGRPKREDFGFFFFLFSLGCVLVAWRNNQCWKACLHVNNLYPPLYLLLHTFFIYFVSHLACFDVHICLFFLNFCFHVHYKCFKVFYKLVDRVIQSRLFIILVLITYCFFFKYCSVNKLTNK